LQFLPTSQANSAHIAPAEGGENGRTLQKQAITATKFAGTRVANVFMQASV
jgi:hypothetical protein